MITLNDFIEQTLKTYRANFWPMDPKRDIHESGEDFLRSALRECETIKHAEHPIGGLVYADKWLGTNTDQMEREVIKAFLKPTDSNPVVDGAPKPALGGSHEPDRNRDSEART